MREQNPVLACVRRACVSSSLFEFEVRATLNRMPQYVDANTVLHASSKAGCPEAMSQRPRARAVA